MGIWDYVILTILVGAAVGALIGMLRKKKGGCCGDCTRCSHCPHK